MKEYYKDFSKERKETDVKHRLIVNKRNGVYFSLKRMSQTSSTKDILGIDIDTYLNGGSKRWI